MNRLATGLIALCLLAASALPAHAFFGTDKFEEEVAKEQAALKLHREVERGDYKVVGTEELKQMKQENTDLLVIDTMPYDASYAKGHIPGAEQFLFPIAEMTEWDASETDGKSQAEFEAMLGPDKDRTIVIYCGFTKCTRSHNGAMWARKLGYTNVYRHPGGIFAWKGMDYPVATVD